MEQHDDNALVIYTDGSMFSKPRRQGGIGIRFVWVDENGHEQIDDYSPPGYAQADVPQMELLAVIEALKSLSRTPPVPPDRYEKIVVYSDAMYLVDGYPASRGSWPANKWRTRNGAPVRNADRWKELTRLVNRIGKRFEVRKVQAHKTNPHNRAADRLARASAKAPSDRTASYSKLRRKASPNRLVPDAVRMEGQRMVIHVHKAEYMRVQGCNSYRYSVESEDSPYYQELGRLYATRDISLNPGHRYDLRVNNDTRNPWIEELYGEVLQDGDPDKLSSAETSRRGGAGTAEAAPLAPATARVSRCPVKSPAAEVRPVASGPIVDQPGRTANLRPDLRPDRPAHGLA